MPTRRQFASLTAALAAALAGGVLETGCVASRGPGQRRAPRLSPVRVSPARVIRQDVGVRPYRPGGFRVVREALAGKTLVHNYGHGGGGVTLSWGTGLLAADLGQATRQTACAVLGAGAVGLAMARILQERGATVRIYAAEPPARTTSAVAGAQWWPAMVYEPGAVTPAFASQFSAAARLSFAHFAALPGPTYGIRWISNYVLSRWPLAGHPAPPGSPLLAYTPELYDLAPGEHPFAAPHVRHYRTLMVDTPRYLQALSADFERAGGVFVRRTFTAIEEIAALPETTVFNCTGAGAGALFGDPGLVPVRGQLVVLRPQPAVDYNLLADDGLYMFPRSDGILLGGTHDFGVDSLAPDPFATLRILRRQQALFAGFGSQSA